MRRLLLYLYPPSWRRRYGDEFAALLEERRPGFRHTADIVRGALDARLHPYTPGASAIRGGAVVMTHERDEIREELHAILVAREELGAEHEQQLVEGVLDRLLRGEFAREPRPRRRSRRVLWSVLLMGVIAAGGGTAAIQQHIPLGGIAQAGPLPDISMINAEVPAPIRRLPLTHYTNRNAPALFGSAIIDDYSGPHPYNFINFNLRYRNCPVTRKGALRLTVETAGYRVTGQTHDGRMFIARTSPIVRWSRPTTFWSRNLAASLMVPAPRKGLYYWKVEVPSARGCAWQIDYFGG